MLILAYREVGTHAQHVENLRWVDFGLCGNRGGHEHPLPVFLEIMALEVVGYVLLTVGGMGLV